MRTRLWVFSDLHLETEGEVDILRGAPTSFDAIVVAGDVDTPSCRALFWLADRFQGCRMIYVPGNHDRWSARLERVTHDEHDENGREVAARFNIDWLDRGSVEVGGVTVHGCTLWTDLRLGYGDLGHSTGMARRGMNDYRRIRRRPSGRHHYIRPEDTREWHRRDLAWLDGALAAPDGLARLRPAVVVTHHAPSPLCLTDPWDPLRHCYASDLRPFIEQHRPDLWIHGHVHHHVDHREASTRIVANGRGRSAEAGDWQPAMIVEVGDGAEDTIRERPHATDRISA